MFLDGVRVPSVASTAAPTAGPGMPASKLVPHEVPVVAWPGLHALNLRAAKRRATPPLLLPPCPPSMLRVNHRGLSLRAEATAGLLGYWETRIGRRMESYNSHPPPISSPLRPTSPTATGAFGARLEQHHLRAPCRRVSPAGWLFGCGPLGVTAAC